MYKVYSKSLKVFRAMKCIQKKRLKEGANENLLKEFHLLKSIDHPNILRLYELYQDQTNYYLITEYCKGGSILDVIRDCDDFSEFDAMRIIKQVLTAVNYCHK